MKPFNITHAAAGAPVRLSDGTENMRVICTDRKGCGSVVALLQGTTWEYLCYFSEAGEYMGGEKDMRGRGVRLVMAPFGTVQDREVYCDDVLCDESGKEFDIVPDHYPIPAGTGWTWPRAYPTTRMTGRDLYAEVFTPCKGDEYDASVAVANAAIRHGIDNGYLREVPPEPDDETLWQVFINAPTVAGMSDKLKTLCAIRAVRSYR